MSRLSPALWLHPVKAVRQGLPYVQDSSACAIVAAAPKGCVSTGLAIYWMGTMTSRKTKGTRRELAAIASLEEQGYIVARSSASLGPADFIAFGPNHVRVVQVKSRANGGPRPSEVQIAKEEMADLPRLPGISYEIWCYEKNGYYWRLTVKEA